MERMAIFRNGICVKNFEGPDSKINEAHREMVDSLEQIGGEMEEEMLSLEHGSYTTMFTVDSDNYEIHVWRIWK